MTTSFYIYTYVVGFGNSNQTLSNGTYALTVTSGNGKASKQFIRR